MEARDVIAKVLEPGILGEHPAGPQAVSMDIIEHLEKAGLEIRKKPSLTGARLLEKLREPEFVEPEGQRLILDPEKTLDNMLAAAQLIELLYVTGNAFRVAMIESGAMVKVPQDKTFDQLRAFETALAIVKPLGS
jgi:hypothetical protein